jgi:hypothetical protein
MKKAFSDVELQNIVDFENKHLDCYRSETSSQPFQSFTIKRSFDSGIGIGVTITCDCCKTSEDITDYDCW